MVKVQIVFTGRGYHQAEAFPEALDLPETATVADALEKLRGELADPSSLPSSCLIALSGEHLGTVGKHQAKPLRDGDELTLIAPVAGG